MTGRTVVLPPLAGARPRPALSREEIGDHKCIRNGGRIEFLVPLWDDPAEMKKRCALALAAAVLTCFVPAARAQNLDEVFRKASPTVVVVRAKGRDVTAAGITRFTETGSGVLISSDGRVMTAAHVVNGKDEITVEGIGGEVVRARIISANAAADVSLLQLERVTKAMRVARIGDSDSVVVGQQVLVVGAPYGLAYSMSVGWISARWPPNTIFPDMPLAEFFQTTATINTGNSGGPLFNMSGEVIGIVSQNISKSGGSEGLGFVVTTKSAQMLLVPRKSFWGALQGMLLTGRLASVFNVPAPAGFLVKTVAEGSTASNMGLQGADGIVTIGGKEIPVGGDIILSVEDIAVVSEDNIEQIRNRLVSMAPGATFKMNVLRAGKVVELKGSAE
jgi:serine protease Do